MAALRIDVNLPNCVVGLPSVPQIPEADAALVMREENKERI
jgi:hypothetical protein